MEKTFEELPILIDGEDKSSPLKNRLRKNYQHLRKWAKKSQTNCFRIYDRDIKEYPAAIDFYAGKLCVHYFADDDKIEALSQHTLQALCSLFDITEEKIYERRRFKRNKTEQYEKRADEKEFFTISEHGALFKINLLDYLDTGLFLDHRTTRQIVASFVKNKRLLNLFAYTCAFSVHAALAGASFTKSVDMSNTYTAWGKENFILNGIPLDHHEIIRADCLKFMEEEIAAKACYDIIVLDPPPYLAQKRWIDSLIFKMIMST